MKVARCLPKLIEDSYEHLIETLTIVLITFIGGCYNSIAHQKLLLALSVSVLHDSCAGCPDCAAAG